MPKLEIEEDEIDKIFRKFGLCANEDEVYSPLSEDEILQMATRAISLIPSFYHDPRRFTVAVWMLISTHVQRYETVQDPKDLDKAIEIAEKHKITAFDCSSYVNIEFSIYEMIADLYARRYYLDDISSDMENAIRLLRIATTITLQECTSACREPHSLVFHNLGVLLYEQCQSSGETSSWEEAIQMMEIAIGHHEVGNDEMSQYLNHLGTIFFGLFEKSGDIKDLDRAIGRIDEAVRLLSEPNDTSDHPDLCSYRENLESLKERRSRFFSATPSKDMTGRTRSSQVSIPTLSLVDSDSDTCVEQDGIALGVKTPTPRALNTPKDCVTQKQLCSNAHCGIARIRSPGQCQQQPQLQPAIPMSEVLFTRSKISPGEEHQSTVSSEVKIRGENSSSEDMVLSNSEPSPYQSELSDDNYRQRDAIDRFNEIMASALSRLAEDLLDDVDWGIQERPSDQSNSTSSSTSDRPTPKSTDSSTLNENSRSRKRLHETPNDLGNDSGASDEEDEDAPRRKKGKASTHELFAKPKKLKCPYYQRRPEEHTKHACRGEGFSGMGKLK
jgi:hypothetical protein